MRITGMVLAALLLAAACSGDDESASESMPTAEAAEPTVTTEPEPTATAEPEPEPATTPEPADAAGAAAAWTNFWAAVSVPDDDAAGLDSALEWGTQEAVDSVRSFPWGSTDRDVANYPVPVDRGDGTFVIDDCMFHTPGFSGTGAVWWTGNVAPDDSGAWKVTSADRESQFDPCVPAEINDAAIAGYEAYLDAVPVFWDPPQPSHPLVAGTMTGNHLDSISGFVEQAEEEGWAVRGRQSSHPEVTQASSEKSVVLLDCYEVDPESGAYVAATGERLDGLIAPVSPGQLNKAAVEMIREEGVWRVKGVNAVLNDACSFAPTSAGLPVV